MYIKNRVISISFKILIILCGVLGILFQCGLFSGNFSFQSFKMFTTLSNVAIIIYFVCAVISLIKNKEKVTFAPTFKFLITISIMLTGLVAFFMLRKMFQNMDQNMKIGLTFLHYCTPIGALLDWILFDEKGKITMKMSFISLTFPAAYVAFAMVGAQFGVFSSMGMGGKNSSRYPYPFMDIDMFGVGKVVLMIIALAVALILVGLVVYAIDKALAKKKVEVLQK